jgi:hypothetical protein
MVQRISAISPRSAQLSVRGFIGLASRTWAALVEFLNRVEPVELLDQRFNFLPRSFRWRGDLWRVRAVVQVWEQPSVGLRPSRRYFEVLCGQGGSCVLFQDLHLGTWYVSL